MRCGHCGAYSSPVSSTQLYLTSCGHFSCNHCLLAAPLPKPPSTGYCYDCKKPCAVVNLSQKHKLSPDVAFYFQDPGPLLQKMVEVYNFQRVHRKRKYECDLKNRLLQDIAAIRSIRKRAEPYLQLYGKVYETLYQTYGVKPSAKKCEFTSAEIDSFIEKVTKIKQELDRGVQGGVRQKEAVTPAVHGIPLDTSMTTPTMTTPIRTPAQGQGSSMFRAKVQSEMRSGGGLSTGNASQCSTPAGSLCSKPSPLLTDHRASSQQQRTPGSGVRTTPGGVRTTPGGGSSASLSIINSHRSRSLHLSDLQTPSPSGDWSESQRRIQSVSSKLSPSSLRAPHSFLTPCLSSTPVDSRTPGYRSMGSSSSRPSNQLLASSGSIQSMSLQRKSISPQHSQRQHSCSPMSVGGTPASMMSVNAGTGSVRKPYLSSSGSVGMVQVVDRRSGPCGPASGSVAGNKLAPPSYCYGNEDQSRRQYRAGMSTTFLSSSHTVGLHSVPRKPLSGMCVKYLIK